MIAMMLSALAAFAEASETPPRDSFLSNLTGRWCIEGRMGETALRQQAEARPVLDGHFVEVRVRQSDAPPPGRPLYEAIYLLGYDAEKGEYVMNLFDTFGVFAPPTPGTGKREGSQIAFLFPYPDGEFVTTMSYEEGGSWTMDQQSRQPDGTLRRFARKHWARC